MCHWTGLQVTEVHISVDSYFSPNPASLWVQQFSGQGLEKVHTIFRKNWGSLHGRIMGPDVGLEPAGDLMVALCVRSL